MTNGRGGSFHDSTEVDATGVIQRAWSSLSDAMALATAGDGSDPPKIIAVNDAFCSLFRMARDEVEGRRLIPFLATENTALRRRIGDVVRERGEAISDFVLVRQPVGDLRVVEWELAPVREPDGRIMHLICLLRDVTLSAVKRPFGTSADVDPMTGLPNQLHFMSRLERAVERASKAEAYTFAVVGLDTEGLKSVERRLGPAVAGTLLEALVRRIRQCLRPGDLIARVSASQLAVLLDHFGPWGTVEDVLTRIEEATVAPYTIAGEHIRLTTVGAAGPICTADVSPGDPRKIMDELERAVVSAKERNGR